MDKSARMNQTFVIGSGGGSGAAPQNRVHSMYQNIMQSEMQREKGLMNDCIETVRNNNMKNE